MKLEPVTHEFVCSVLPTTACHASTILPLEDGRVLCAWFGGSAEGNRDVDIWVSGRERGIWTQPVKISAGNEPHWNPVLWQKNADVIGLFFKVGMTIAHWRTFYCESRDGGKMWDVPREMIAGDTSGGRGPVRNKILKTASGRILAPCSTEDGSWIAYIDRSEDGGSTWTRSEPIQIQFSDVEKDEKYFHRGVIQPTLWESPEGQIHMLLRSTEGFIYRSDSTDDGIHWCDPYSTSFPNNNSGIDLDRLNDGTLALVCNPVQGNGGARTPISMFLSDNDGFSWEKYMDLDTGEGEFSYPAVVRKGSELFVSYTWKRKNIAFWQFHLTM